MITRLELKQNAKNALRNYYWNGLLVCLIVGFISNFGSGGTSFISNINEYRLPPRVIMIIAVGVLIFSLIGMLLNIFVGSPVQVGKASFFLKSRNHSTKLSEIWFAFNKAHYWNIVKVMFIRSLIIFAWLLLFFVPMFAFMVLSIIFYRSAGIFLFLMMASLLLIIPSTIKQLDYSQLVYIMAEQPSMNYKEALAKSKTMMYGYRWFSFVLDLSFLGWILLGILACCIGVIFVNPYIEATYVEFYEYLKYKEGSTGEPQQDQVL